MATLTVKGSPLGTQLQELLMADDIVPGSGPSYQTCKTIYAYHPLGAKIVEKPIQIAQSQQRDISIQKGPEDRLREQYIKTWSAYDADRQIFNSMRLARIYGVSSLALLVNGQLTSEPIKLSELWDKNITFSQFDPLNTAGSLVLNQDPNAVDFLKVKAGIAVAGQYYHGSKIVVTMNEDPIYIEYTSSGFGYVGRSVYQRALYPLKSYIQTLITDDMVTRKAGVLVAAIKSAGSILDSMMQKVGLQKINLIKQAETDNVIQVGQDDKVESLNMQNLDAAYGAARSNVIENISSAVPMPAKLMNDETFAEGFGEGVEDSKAVAQYIDDLRKQMGPLYAFMDMVMQRMAWTPEFYKLIQKDFPDLYAGVPFESAFYEWQNSFAANWPSLLQEPPSEEIKIDDVKLKAIVALMEVLLPLLDPHNKTEVVKWACDNFNSLKMLFDANLNIDYEALLGFLEERAEQMNSLNTGANGNDGNEDGDDKIPPPPRMDSADNKGVVARRLAELTASVSALPALNRQAGRTPVRQ